MANSKSLIAYFSRSGNNYVGGSIVNLSIGNTEVIANKIQELTGSGMGSSEGDIKKLCPGATVVAGLAIKGSSVGKADKEVANWLKKLNLIG